MNDSMASRRDETHLIDDARVSALAEEVLGWQHQAIPAQFHGQTVSQFRTAAPALDQLQTPVLTLDREAMSGNLERFAQWCQQHGVLAAPHGKTTMAPALWQWQLEHGAWGITLANAHQVRTARGFGLQRIMIANAVTDPQAIAYLAAETAAGADIYSWADSVRTVKLLNDELAKTPGVTLPLIAELGAPGGRTGARTDAEGLEIARVIASSKQLRLVGVGGYEGSLAHTTDDNALAIIRGYLDRVGTLHRAALTEGLYETDTVLLTAGGSAYFDNVVAQLSTYTQEADGEQPAVRVLLRSGAYLIHDDGFYRGISPLGRANPDAETAFRAGMHAWVRVVSQPEPGLAILDAGKRDLPFDEGLPVVHGYAHALGETLHELPDSEITAVNDQHAFLRYAADAELNPGDVIRLGLSHPCTALDKWSLIPVLDSARSPQTARVVDLVRTYF